MAETPGRKLPPPSFLTTKLLPPGIIKPTLPTPVKEEVKPKATAPVFIPRSEPNSWQNEFQKFIFSTLSPILQTPDQGYIPEYTRFVDKPAMKVWIQAFTHETYDYDNNYEKLEFRGDAVLKSIFPLYLMDRYPHLDESELTELNRAYMSKISQSKMSQKLGFNRWIRIEGVEVAIVNIETDVFEAFFGALEVVGSSIYEGWGDLYCRKMIRLLFDDQEIDLDLGEGAFKTVVNQIFRRFELGEPRMETSMPGREFSSELLVSGKLLQFMENYVPSANDEFLVTADVTDSDPKTVKNILLESLFDTFRKSGLVSIENSRGESAVGEQLVTVSIVLLPEHLQFLTQNGIKIPRAKPGKYILAQVTASTKAAAEFAAYKEAHDKLKSWGVTKAWAAAVKQEADFRIPEIARFVPAALAKLQAQGFDEMEFFIPRKLVNETGAVVQLLGVKKGEFRDSKTKLASVRTSERTNGFLAGKIAAIQKYISN